MKKFIFYLFALCSVIGFCSLPLSVHAEEKSCLSFKVSYFESWTNNKNYKSTSYDVVLYADSSYTPCLYFDDNDRSVLYYVFAKNVGNGDVDTLPFSADVQVFQRTIDIGKFERTRFFVDGSSDVSDYNSWSTVLTAFFDFHNDPIVFDCNCLVFENETAMNDFILYGDRYGLVYEPIPEDSGQLSEDMPVPIISRNNQTDECSFTNGSDDYTVEIKGRWWTVDDIYSYKESLMWKHKYDSLLKNDLSIWVTALDKMPSNKSFNPNVIGKNSFDSLLVQYPINSRSYTGGTNAIGNYFSGYSDALANFKLLLGASSSSFNSWEIYARYRYVKPDGSIIYSKWAHMYTGLADPEGSSGSDWDDGENTRQEYQNNEGLRDDDIWKLEDKNSRDDPHAIPKVNFDKDWSDSVEGLVNTSNQIFSLFSGLFGLMGSVPSMIASVFGFLPSWFISFLSISLGLVVLMRFVGR